MDLAMQASVDNMSKPWKCLPTLHAGTAIVNLFSVTSASCSLFCDIAFAVLLILPIFATLEMLQYCDILLKLPLLCTKMHFYSLHCFNHESLKLQPIQCDRNPLQK